VSAELKYLAALLKLESRHMVVLCVPRLPRVNTDSIPTQRLPTFPDLPVEEASRE
jgi:hypothetical protein